MASDAARWRSPQGEAAEVGPSLVASGCDGTPHGSSAAVSARKINHNFKSLCCRGSDSSPARQRREARVECLKMRVVRPAEGLHTHARLAGARCQIVNAAASAAGRSIAHRGEVRGSRSAPQGKKRRREEGESEPSPGRRLRYTGAVPVEDMRNRASSVVISELEKRVQGWQNEGDGSGERFERGEGGGVT